MVVPVALSLTACSSGTSSGSCAAPQLTVVPEEIRPGATVSISGVYFVDGCDDRGTGEEGRPLQDQEVTLTVGGEVIVLGTVDAASDGTIEADVRLPASLPSGEGELAVGYLPSRTVTVIAAPVTPAARSLDVECSPSGIEVSASAVATTPAGVVLNVSSTMPAGSYLNYSGGGIAGGDPLPVVPDTWVLLNGPGALTLSCTKDGDPAPGGETVVQVVDAGGFWSATTLEDLGCPMAASFDWGGAPGRGLTAQQAVDDLVRELEADGRDLAAARAAVGYPEAASERWIVSTEGGGPYVAVVAIKGADGRVTAYPDWICSLP